MKNVDLLVLNATIITMDENRRIIDKAGMAIEGDKILAIGDSAQIKKEFSADKTIDASDRYIFPGLINTHNHLFQVLLKGFGKDRGLLAWLDSSVRRAYRNITLEDIYLATAVGCIEQLKSGVTTVLDYQYAHGIPNLSDAVIQAMEDVGIRGILGRGYTDTINFPDDCKCSHNETEEEFFNDVKRLSKKHEGSSTIDIALAPGIIWSFSKEGFQECVKVAKELNTFTTMHTIESPEDNDFSIKTYGMSTIQFLEKVGILSSPFLAVHCAEIKKEEIELFSQYDVKVSYNPISNMIMGYKTLPVMDLLEKNIKVGLATDGAASNDNQNMLEVLKISTLWQKAFYRDPAVLSAGKVLEMATIDGAATIFKEKSIGSLEPGKKADFFVFNPIQCNTIPIVDPVVSIVYGAGENNIETTVVDGKVVLENGKILGVPEEELLHRIQRRSVELWDKSNLSNSQWNQNMDFKTFGNK